MLALGVVIAGCAQPQGTIFEPLSPPRVWPPAPQTPRIRLVGALHSSADLRAGKSSGEAWKETLRGPRRPIGFSSPHAVAAASDGLLAVADVGLAGVHILDLHARTHTLVNGWLEHTFQAPIGVCWVGRRLFVTDAGLREVIELTPEGRFVRRFGADTLKRPVGIAYVPARDLLYVVDGGADCLRVFTPAGELRQTLGQSGGDPGEFNHPTHIVAGEGFVAVADTANFRVQLLDLDGKFLRVIGQRGDAAGDLALPKGLGLDSDGHLYVVDARFENVQIFNQQGQLLLAIGHEGNRLGEFALPAGLSIDANDRIWVADSANRRVQVFDYLGNAS